jgi:hypothetical protein
MAILALRNIEEPWVVVAGFTQMRPDEVEEWLQRDTRNLTLAVYTVLKATVEDARPRVWFMGSSQLRV